MLLLLLLLLLRWLLLLLLLLSLLLLLRLLLLLLLLLLQMPTSAGTAVGMCPLKQLCGLLFVRNMFIQRSSIVFTVPIKPA
jgi:hypothetical protein